MCSFRRLGLRALTLRADDELVERMNNHEFELIAVGRALLQDPEWLVKVKEGRLGEVEAFARKSLAKLY